MASLQALITRMRTSLELVTRTRDGGLRPRSRFPGCSNTDPLVPMTKSLRLLLATATVATVALGGAARAVACGNNNGYSYAGIGAPTRAYGISALISPLDAFDVLNGHVAGWVGVGGPGEGPNGSNEWIQVGYAGFPSITGSDIYYEVAQPGRFPTYHQVSDGLGGRDLDQGDRARDARPRELVARVGEPQARLAADPPAREPRRAGARSRRPRAGTAGRAARATRSSTASATSRSPMLRAAAGTSSPSGYPIQSAATRIQRARGSSGLPRGGRPAGLPAPRRYFLIQIGVPSGA